MTLQLSNSSPSFMTTVPALSTTANTMAAHIFILTAWVMSAKASSVWVNSISISISSSTLSVGSFYQYLYIFLHPVCRILLQTVSHCVPECEGSYGLGHVFLLVTVHHRLVQSGQIHLILSSVSL